MLPNACRDRANRRSGVSRSEAGLTLSQIDRDYDRSEFARTVIPRLEVEYQPTRAPFFRVVTQYQAQPTSGPLTPEGLQIVRLSSSARSGGLTPSAPMRRSQFRDTSSVCLGI